MLTDTLTSWLETLRAPIATMTGLSEDAVVVYAQQDVESAVLDACARHQCAVLLGLPSGSGSDDSSQSNPVMAVDLEVEVWTPKLTMGPGSVLTLDVAEWIMHGLHGYRPPERAATNGRNRIPAFRRYGLRVENKDGSEWLVANLQFSVPMKANARPESA